uniref:Uncharacterized protein n=1 Tax=Arundo donax TaxID=35708 RepID=A0A0A9BNJ6_ARUDO
MMTRWYKNHIDDEPSG